MSSLDVITVVTLPSAGPLPRYLSLSLSLSVISLSLLLCVISAESTGREKRVIVIEK